MVNSGRQVEGTCDFLHCCTVVMCYSGFTLMGLVELGLVLG